MIIHDDFVANFKRFRLRSGGSLTFAASNLFGMKASEREFILETLAEIEDSGELSVLAPKEGSDDEA